MPENDSVSRKEHEEFARRLEDNLDRLDKRVDHIENQNGQITDLLVLVNKLANSMDHMMKEQEEQGKRLDRIESKDGEMWRKFVGYVISAVVGAIITVLISNALI